MQFLIFKLQYYLNIIYFRYKSLRHESNAPKGNPDRVRLLQDSNKRSKKEGYSSLKYDLVNFRLLHLYTYVLVDLEKT